MNIESTIEGLRVRTNEAHRELLGDDLLGRIIGTEVEIDDIFARRFFSWLPLQHISFGGRGLRFYTFQTSMLLTTLVAAFFVFSLPRTEVDARMNRVTATETVQQLTPMQARVKRLQDAHAAASKKVEETTLPPVEEIQPLHESAPSTPDVITPTPRFARSDNKQGIYLAASTVARTDSFNEKVDALIAAGGSTIIMDVKGGGVLFHSAAPAAHEIGLVRNLYELPEIIRVLHEKNIYVMGRFVAIKDEAYTAKKPDTRIKNPKTGVVLSPTWIDPANDEAIEFNMQVVCELAAAGIDEINLDYIRFSTAQFGALKVYSGQEKADRVEKFIKATRETIDRCGPNTKLGLSTYAILGWNYPANVETLGQDVVRFAPLVDIISPMAYPATFTSPEYYIPGKNPGPRMYYLVYRTLTGYAELLGEEHKHKIRPWIQGYSVGAQDVSEQIRAVYDAGFCGYTVWNASNTYAQTFAAMKKDTLKPARCLDASVALEQ